MDPAMISKSNLMNMLKQGIITVIFTKKDGSERTIRCTLSESMAVPYEGKRTKEVNPDIVPVWDVDNAGWRSFRYDSIISIAK